MLNVNLCVKKCIYVNFSCINQYQTNTLKSLPVELAIDDTSLNKLIQSHEKFQYFLFSLMVILQIKYMKALNCPTRHKEKGQISTCTDHT